MTQAVLVIQKLSFFNVFISSHILVVLYKWSSSISLTLSVLEHKSYCNTQEVAGFLIFIPSMTTVAFYVYKQRLQKFYVISPVENIWNWNIFTYEIFISRTGMKCERFY